MSAQDGIDSAAEALDAEAIDWVVRLTVGHASNADHAAFDRWLRTSPAHERAFAAAAELGGHFRRLPLSPDAAALPPAQSATILPFTPSPRQPRIGRRAFLSGGGAVAASVAAGVMAVHPPLGLWPSLAELMADERTGAGQRRSFSPMAGVVVELNSRSSVSRSNGALALIDGEAFISVSGLAQPFRLLASGASVTTSRASFNVQSLGGTLCVTCVSGSADVANTSQHARIVEGQEARVGANTLIREDGADPFARLAWRRGLLILRRTPLGEAIEQINRYFPGRLVLTDRAKAAWPVTGVFHLPQIEVAPVQLERLLSVRLTRLPGGLVLLG